MRKKKFKLIINVKKDKKRKSSLFVSHLLPFLLQFVSFYFFPFPLSSTGDIYHLIKFQFLYLKSF